MAQPSESTDRDLVHDFFPFFKVYKDGHIHRYAPIEFVSPGNDPHLSVTSKDVVISFQPPISARIFMPQNVNFQCKLPVVVYFHGGGFALGSAFDPTYHNYVTSLVVKSNVVVVSVEYRLAPENPIPACYDDSCEAFRWVASHAKGSGPDPWLNRFGDFSRVFMAGDSVGANIAHNVAVRVNPQELRLVGLILVHPFFIGTKYDNGWFYMCPQNYGNNDFRLNPKSKDFAKLGFEKVLIVLAGKDSFRHAGLNYYEKLKGSGWKGITQLVKQEGVGHTFHLFEPHSKQAMELMEILVSFINHEHSYLKSNL